MPPGRCSREDHRGVREACGARRLLLGVAAGQRLQQAPGARSNRQSSPTPARCRRRRSIGWSCSPTTWPPTSASSPARTRTSCTAADRLALERSPVVIQVPDFGDRFWVYQAVDLRTDSFVRLGKMYGDDAGLLPARRAGLAGRRAGRHHAGVSLTHQHRLRRAAHLHGRHRRRIGRPSSVCSSRS